MWVCSWPEPLFHILTEIHIKYFFPSNGKVESFFPRLRENEEMIKLTQVNKFLITTKYIQSEYIDLLWDNPIVEKWQIFNYQSNPYYFYHLTSKIKTNVCNTNSRTVWPRNINRKLKKTKQLKNNSFSKNRHHTTREGRPSLMITQKITISSQRFKWIHFEDLPGT